ncbi:MAG: 3-methylornithyl-N6-L-lysine dehydrogenase PylD [Methanosarcinaceae archaeon]|nr:3-methylornithyl-N6-L-lysine dehydrogenase PylD [Methanosarcinaceae archaeon]
MALLTPDDLKNIKEALEINDRNIQKLTGKNLKELCSEIYDTKPNNEKVGIVPITAGGGVIGSFSESLLYTTTHFGMGGFITEKTDVAGYYEAVLNGAEIILMADDHTYMAHNLLNGKISHNQISTGIVYSEILVKTKDDFFKDCETEELKDVLAIGIGKVGTPAIKNLIKYGYNVYVHDSNPDVVTKCVEEYGVHGYDPNSKKRFFKIFEATPTPNTIKSEMLKAGVVVSTPGIPCAIEKKLIKKYNVTAIQEPLGIGTMSMLYAVFDNKI